MSLEVKKTVPEVPFADTGPAGVTAGDTVWGGDGEAAGRVCTCPQQNVPPWLPPAF